MKPLLLSLLATLFVIPLSGQAASVSTTDNPTIQPIYRMANSSLKSNEVTSNIRILFYYLQSPLDKAGSIDNLNRLLDQQIKQANEIFSNSNIPVTFELAAANPWPFDTEEWLTFRAKDIYKAMSSHVQNLWANGLFHKVGGDVMFLVDQRDPKDTHCGWATIDTEKRIRDKTTTRSYGIIRLGRGCGTDASVLAHEIGHLLGAAHGYGESLKASSYLGYGVRCAGKSTLMHPNFPKHNFVSSPNRSIGGEACGYQDSADNRQLFIERAPLLAAKVDERPFTASLTEDANDQSALALNSNLDPQYEHLLSKEDSPSTSEVTTQVATSEDEDGNNIGESSSAGDNHPTAGSFSFTIFSLLILVILPIFGGTHQLR